MGKGQAKILTVVLIILIVIIAMAILWNVVVPLIKEKSESVEFGQFTIGLEIQKVIVFGNGVSMISVNRKSGDEELDGLKFVFYDSEGNSVTREGGVINELETKTYSFSAIDESGFGTIARVGVAPIINNDLGMVIESEPESVLSVPRNVVSWWKFDDLNDFVGGNICNVLDGGISEGVLNGKVDCSSNGLNLNEFAISFWIQGLQDRALIRKLESYEISLINNQDIKFDDLRGKSGTSELSGGVVGGGWNHIVISINSVTPKIYVNSYPRYIEDVRGFTNFGTNNLEIFGEIDEVMIFDSSLDSTQVIGIYNIQKKE